MLRPFNTVPNVVLTPNSKIIFIAIHNCDLATAMNRNVFISVFRWSYDPVKGSFDRFILSAQDLPTPVGSHKLHVSILSSCSFVFLESQA